MSCRRIAYVLKMYPRFSETFIVSELLELERQGLDLHVFSLKRPSDGITHADVARLRAPVTYLPESLPALIPEQLGALRRDRRRYLRVLAAVLRRRRRSALKHFLQAGAIVPHLEGVRHVHAHFASGATSVALYLHRLCGVSYSFTAHAKDIYLDTIRPADLARKLREARFAVTVSDFNVHRLEPLSNAGRVVRIYNGLDLGRFSADGGRRAEPPLVLAVGRLIEKKGFDDLLRACALLTSAGIALRCTVVGKGPLARELGALVRELGLEGVVELAGPLPREEPTGIPELVEDGVTGLLVPQRDPPALAAALTRLLDDPALGRRLVARGRERVERGFDLRRNVAVLRRLFEEAVP